MLCFVVNSTMFDLPTMEELQYALDPLTGARKHGLVTDTGANTSADMATRIREDAAASAAATSGAGIVTGSGVTTVADVAASVRDPSIVSGAAVSASCGCCQPCGQEPVFTPFKLAAFSTSKADEGKPLMLYGRDDRNQVLGWPNPCLEIPIQYWHEGVEGQLFMDLASWPPNSFELSGPVRDVERVGKAETAGMVSLYSFDEDTYKMYFLSKYHPQETNPRYRRYRITHPNYCAGSSVYALCELGYVPLESLDDVLIVQNMDALKMMVMAIEFENEREFQAAKAYEADAYRLIEEQRTGERTHDYNLIQTSKCWGFGGIRAL